MGTPSTSHCHRRMRTGQTPWSKHRRSNSMARTPRHALRSATQTADPALRQGFRRNHRAEKAPCAHATMDPPRLSRQTRAGTPTRSTGFPPFLRQAPQRSRLCRYASPLPTPRNRRCRRLTSAKIQLPQSKNQILPTKNQVVAHFLRYSRKKTLTLPNISTLIQ